MKVLVLDGAVTLRDLADSVLAVLSSRLGAEGHSVVRRDLSTLEVPDCRGDFGCWTVTPGVCVQPGAHRELARELVHSDLVVWLTPVTFGGYSSTLKKLLDHLLPLILPTMGVFDGETHHPPRYARFPSVLAIGLQDGPEPYEAAVFQRLVRRNVLNMHPPHHAAVVVRRDDVPRLDRAIATGLADLARSRRPPAAAEPLDLAADSDAKAARPATALLVVGSPRGPASVSAAIAEHLAARLRERGVTVAAGTLVGSRLRTSAGARELVASWTGADVVALVTPVYVDSLPAPVTEALEILARERGPDSRRARLLAIANCGFPEAVHADTALAICRAFARRSNLAWAGGLAVGGGGMLAGKPLAQLGGRGRFATRALELTAEAVARGEAVPDDAQRLVRELPVPRWLYRRIADWGFVRAARAHGARLLDRPYAP